MKQRVEEMIYWCAYYCLKFNGKDIPTEKSCPSRVDIHKAMVKVSGLHGATLTEMMDAMGYPYSRIELQRYRAVNRELKLSKAADKPNFAKASKKKKKKTPKPQLKPVITTKPQPKPQSSVEFFASDEWRAIRYRALEKHGATCQCCGRGRKSHGVVLHVDHIKPRSKFPDLALDINNLQILCEDCNLGKSNKFSTDWR